MGAKWVSLLFQKTIQQAGETPPRHSKDAGSTPAASIANTALAEEKRRRHNYRDLTL